jgi:hypothetical protein
MTSGTVQSIQSRTTNDPAFRLKLLNNPSQALESYKLTLADREALTGLVLDIYSEQTETFRQGTGA